MPRPSVFRPRAHKTSWGDKRARRTVARMGRQFTTVALGALLLVSVGAAAPRAAKPRTIATGWRVTALAADGVRAAFVVSVTDPGSGCAGVKLWEPLRTRRPTPASLSGRG